MTARPRASVASAGPVALIGMTALIGASGLTACSEPSSRGAPTHAGAGGRTDGPPSQRPGSANGPHTPVAADDAPAGSPSPTPALADAPVIDLLHNRFRWHLSPPDTARGVLIPVASEGLRKYTQEYRSPWGAVLSRDGRAGRALTARAATLRFPWAAEYSTGAAQLRLRLYGIPSRRGREQRLSLSLNGARVANTAIEAGWGVAEIALDAGRLRAGENELQLVFGASAGGGPTALVHSVEIVAAAAPSPAEPGAAPPPPASASALDTANSWPSLSPAVAAAGESQAAATALAGFPAMSLYVEIPATAWLTFDAIAGDQAATFHVSARAYRRPPGGDQPPPGGDQPPPAGAADYSLETIELVRHQAAAGSRTEQRVNLAGLADRLVELRLSVTGPGARDAAWGRPRIALERAVERPQPGPYRHAIVLVIDALRSDRLALYGPTRVKTPHITADGRRRGVVFSENQAASPSSPPSHASIQTGMIPRVHGVAGDRDTLKPGTPMLSTQVGQAGIKSGYFGNNPFGMARLEEPGAWTAFHQPNKEGKGIDCTVLMDEILAFAEAQAGAGERYFVSSLPYETHTPYRYHEGISDRYHPGPWPPPVGKNVDGVLLSKLSSGSVTLSDAQWAQLKALYDGEAEYMDGCYRRLLDGLEARDLASDTLIVVTSDHGEGMFEHGRMGHAFGHYAELANVPLVLIGDGLVGDGERGVQIATVTSHLDIAPTVLDLLGVPKSDRIQGLSLVPMLRRDGPWPPRVISLEYGRSYALRAKRWKYIVDYQQNEAVFDLAQDPTEQHDLVTSAALPLRYLRDSAGFFLAHRRAWRSETFGSLNDHHAGFLEHVAAE